MGLSISDFSNYRLPVIAYNFKVFFEITEPKNFHETDWMVD